jgi:hypothetical protein
MKLRHSGLVLVAFALALPGGAFGAQAASAASAPPTAFGAIPGPNAATKDGYFWVSAAPGTSVDQPLFLSNDGAKAIRLRLAAVDGTTGSFGGVSYGLPGDPTKGVGTWVHPDKTEIDLAPRSSTTVTLHIDTPSQSRPGDHVGGIAVWDPSATSNPSSSTAGFGAAVTMTTRKIVAVVVRVPGDTATDLSVGDARPVVTPHGVDIGIGLSNTGGNLTKAQGVIRIPAEGFERRFSVDTFVPDTSIIYPVRWRDSLPSAPLDADVELSIAGRTVTWHGVIAADDGMRRDLSDRQVVTTQPSSPSRAPVSAPLAAAVGAAALSVAVTGVVLRRRWRRIRPQNRLIQVDEGHAQSFPGQPHVGTRRGRHFSARRSS